MTAGLETFAKVRALHDRAAMPGEKAAALTGFAAGLWSAYSASPDEPAPLHLDAAEFSTTLARARALS